MKKYLLLYLVFSGIFLLHYLIAGHAVYGDGNDYWAYVHTWYFDGNIDQNNEFRHEFSAQNNNRATEILSPGLIKTGYTSIGKTDNIHPPGTAVFYLPFYLLADLLIYLFNSLGASFPRNGYSDLYQIVVGLGVTGYVTLSAFLTDRLIFHFSPNRRLSFLCTLTIFLSSQLLYYGSYDILNSHFASYFLSVSFWFVYFTADFSRFKPWLTSALLIALAALVRIQDVLLFAPLLLRLRPQNAKHLLPCIGIFLLALSPQFYNWWYLYGTPLPHTYIANLDVVSHTDFLGSLFHPITGIVRTPILFIALLGLPFAGSITLPFLVFFLATYSLVTYQAGWSAAAYGARMYISTLPLFTLLLSKYFQKTRFRNALSLSVIFILLNMVSITSFVLFEKEVNSGHKRGLEESTVLKINDFITSLKVKL